MAKSSGFSGMLSALVTTLWVGALWMTAITVYVLFHQLSDRSLAGAIAGKLFAIVSIIGIVSGAWLLLQCFRNQGLGALKLSVFWALFVMWLLVLIGEFGIQPLLAQLKASAFPQNVMQSVFASRFNTWHGIASVAYVIDCVLGVWLVIKSRN